MDPYPENFPSFSWMQPLPRVASFDYVWLVNSSFGVQYFVSLLNFRTFFFWDRLGYECFKVASILCKSLWDVLYLILFHIFVLLLPCPSILQRIQYANYLGTFIFINWLKIHVIILILSGYSVWIQYQYRLIGCFLVLVLLTELAIDADPYFCRPLKWKEIGF